MSSAAPKISLLSEIEGAVESLILQPNYPCIGALTALKRGEIRYGSFEGFGRGVSWRSLRAELERFVRDQKSSRSVYLTYIAAYPGPAFADEEEFEAGLWRELSYLTSREEQEADWAGATVDPGSRDFCFHLGGEKIFVVGLHPASSRKSRRLPWPALVFNLFSQFEALQRQGRYDPMVRTNRERDRRFQGNVNPMAELHGEGWESVQFSGKSNGPEWKCPFQFLPKEEKP